MTKRKGITAFAFAAALVTAPSAFAQGFSLGGLGGLGGSNFDTAYADWQRSTIDSVEAFKVTTRQAALSAEQAAVSFSNTAKTTLDFVVATSLRRAFYDAQTRFATNQAAGNGLCTFIEATKANERAQAVQEEFRATRPEFETRWVEEGGDARTALMTNEAMQNRFFCSQAEQVQGRCTVEGSFGGTPGGGSSAAPWLTRRSYGNLEAALAAAYQDTIAPMPTLAPPERRAVSVDEMYEWAEARRRAAVMSMARASVDSVVAEGLQGYLEDAP